MGRSFIAGGAGFIGSHLAHELLRRPDEEVVIFDNLSSGDEAHLADVLEDARLELVVGDLQSAAEVTGAMAGCTQVFHFAANPDIAKAVTEPTIDFWQGTYLTNNVVDAMRINEV
ncbi:MAG: dependent epimerase/dehydratase family protein [Solirubrobacterales bacterium]|nr:dependent epimerase/dehydratase family protein [Solirubrobacterales bacterium]